MDPIVSPPGAGEELPLGAAHGRIAASAEQTGGRFALIECLFPPGFEGPPPHRHREMHDCFYVVAGRLRLRLGDETVDLDAGGFAAVPPGTVHTFANPFDEPATVLNLYTPGGLEAYLRELASLGHTPTPGEMADLASRYDFERADS
jgi:mannose-6-phosphate isomerase-like protein (cupin superfamily)